MAKKDEFDLDDDDDFLKDMDGDLDMGGFMDEMPKDDRKPATKIAAGAIRAFNVKDNGLDFASDVVKGALPNTYNRALGEAKGLKNEAVRLYDKTAKELEPSLKIARGALKKVLPAGLAARLKDDTGTNYTESGPRDYAGEEIASAIQNIFDGQKEQTAETIKHKRKELGLKRQEFRFNAEHQTAISSGISRLVGYQDQVLDKFHRKSLELQMRHYFTMKEALDHSRASATDMSTQLAAIVKNTGLPNEVKLSTTEAVAAANINRVIGMMQESSRNRLGQFTRKLTTGLHREASNFAQSFNGSIEQMQSMGSMADDMGMGMGGTHGMVGEMAGGMVRDSFGGLLATKLKKDAPAYLDKLNPNITKYGKHALDSAGRIAEDYPAMMTRKMRESNGQGFWGFLENVMGDYGQRDSINHNLRKDGTQPVAWDLLSRRTLIEIIPGYLSRSVEQLSNIYNILSGSNEKVDREVYSTKHETFVKHSTLVNATHKDFKNTLGVGLRDRVKEILEFVDPEQTLTPAEKLDVSLMLAKDAEKGYDFDPTRYSQAMTLVEFLPGGLADKVADLFSAAFGVSQSYDIDKGRTVFKMDKDKSEGYYNMASSFRGIRNNTGDFNELLNTHNAMGEKGALRDAGILNQDGTVNQDYRWKLIREMLENDNGYDFYKTDLMPDMSQATAAPEAQQSLMDRMLGRKGKNKVSGIPSASGTVADTSGLEKLLNSLTTSLNSLSTQMSNFKPNDTTDYYKSMESMRTDNTVHYAKEESLLERIIATLEEIKEKGAMGVPMMGEGSVPMAMPQKEKGWMRNALEAPWNVAKGVGRGGRGLWNGAGRVGDFLKPVRHGLFDAGMWGMGKGLGMARGAAGLGLRGMGALGGFTGRSLYDIGTKLPGRLANTGQMFVDAGGYLGNLALDPAMWAGGKAWGGIKGLGNYALGTAQKLPGRLSEAGANYKKGLGFLSGMGSDMFHGAGNLLGRFGGRLGRDKPSMNEELIGPAKPTIFDVYIKGDGFAPILSAVKLKQGEYFDKLSGVQIKSFADIKGEVVDRTGAVVLSASDFMRGLIDSKGQSVMPFLSNAQAGINKRLEAWGIDKGKLKDLKWLDVKDRFSKYKDQANGFIDGNARLSKWKQWGMGKAGSLKNRIWGGGPGEDFVGPAKPSLKDRLMNTSLASYGKEKSDSLLSTLAQHGITKDSIAERLGKVGITSDNLKKVGKFGFGGMGTAAGALANFTGWGSAYDRAAGFFGKGKEGEEKKDPVVERLDKIYNHLKKAFPIKREDKELMEADRINGVNDIIRKKKAANDERAARKAKLLSAPGAAGNNAAPGGKAPEAANDSGHGLLDSAVDFVKDKGSAILGGLGAGTAATTVATAGGAAATVAGEAAVAGEVVGAAGGLLATLGTIGSGIAAASNPIGWALLAGAAMYGGYKAYKAYKRHADLEPLEMLRYLQYGIPVDNTDLIATMRYFEDEMGDIIVPTNGMPKVSLPPEKIWSKYCGEFGTSSDDVASYKRFMVWFYKRFLPVYIKHSVAAKLLAKVDLQDVDDKLTTEERFRFVNIVQFGAEEAAKGMNPLAIMDSPWKDVALAKTGPSIDILSDKIRSECKRDGDTDANNTAKLVPAALAIQKGTLPKDKPKPIVYDSRTMNVDGSPKTPEQMEKEKSYVEKFKDWSRENLVDPGKRMFNSVAEGIRGAAKSAGELAGKAIDWSKEHIVEPIANSLAGLIRGAESGKAGYNAYNRGTMGGKILGPLGPRNLTSMTVAEILTDMDRPISDPKRLFAIGKYQMIPSTLRGAIQALGVDPNTTYFNDVVQEKFFSDYLLDKKRKNISAYIKGKSNNPTAALNDAAAEWASIADPKTGASKYGHGNKASVSAESLLSCMNTSRDLYKQYVSQGMSEQDAYQKAVATDASALGQKPDQAAASAGTAGASGSTLQPPSMGGTAPTTGAPAQAGPTVARANAQEGQRAEAPTSRNPMKAAETVTPATSSATDMPSVVDTATSPAGGQAANASSQMPDLSHISHATYRVGEGAAAQRDAHLQEQQRTNDLLSQLLTKEAPASPQPAPQQIAAVMPAPRKEVSPVISVDRTY